MTFQSSVFRNNKVMYIGLGVLLGLALSYIAFSFFKTKELQSEVAKQTIEIESLRQHTDSITNELLPARKARSEKEKTVDEINKTMVVPKEVENIKSSEDTNWQDAVNENTFVTFIEYLSTNTKSEYHSEAVSKLSELGAAGWLYVGRTSNNKKFSQDQIAEVIWRNNSDQNLSNMVPLPGDIVRLISPSARRTYSNFSPRDHQNGLWEKNKKAYVSEVKMEGPTAVIIKLIYN